MATEFYCQYACVLSKITKKKLVKLHGESPQFPRVVYGTYVEYKVKKANSTQKLLWLVPILKLYLNWITALLLSCFARKTNVSTDFFFYDFVQHFFHCKLLLSSEIMKVFIGQKLSSKTRKLCSSGFFGKYF